MKKLINNLLKHFGYRLVRMSDWRPLSRFERFNEPFDVLDIIKKNTMISDSRLINIKEVVSYVSTNNLLGAYVECGVWKGGGCFRRFLFK